MRHIVALSGGKDSAALALYLKGKVEAEYVFCDTGRELPEIYEFLDHLEKRLGHIERVQSWGRDFDWHLKKTGYFLPSAHARWCTTELKLRPFERYIGKSQATVYIGLRADEDRVGNYGLKSNIVYAYPLREAGIDLAGVKQILAANEISLPGFYKWRTVGGCWCCPFQRKKDWMGLKMFHPALFQRACEDEEASGSFTWVQGHRLNQVEAAWQLPLAVEQDEFEDHSPCLICAK